MKSKLILKATAAALLTSSLPASAADTVKVFLLAGQSNMEGKADNKLIDHQATDAKTKEEINDLRKDLKSPKLPVVIAAIGNNGSKEPAGGMLAVSSAQLSMNEVPEYKGNVKAFRTDVLVDKAAEELFPTWKDNIDAWNLVGSDRPYHYLGSAIWYTRIGHGMGEGMIELMDR